MIEVTRFTANNIRSREKRTQRIELEKLKDQEKQPLITRHTAGRRKDKRKE